MAKKRNTVLFGFFVKREFREKVKEYAAAAGFMSVASFLRHLLEWVMEHVPPEEFKSRFA